MTDAMACVRLPLKVVPGAPREGIDGWLGDALKVRVGAAPEKGRANAAVEVLLAAALELPARSVRVVNGHTQPRKTVEIAGIDATTLAARIAMRLSDPRG